MNKAQLEKRMMAQKDMKPVTDYQMFQLVMKEAFSDGDDRERIEKVLDMLLRCAKSKMDNLKSMTEGYRGSIKASYISNIYLLSGILTNNQPIRKKIIVALALVNELYERVNRHG